MVLRTQVLVVGGGPAGATAARRLSEAGINVILIEKDLGHRKPCGGGISSTALKELDIPLEMPHSTINKIRFVSPSNRRLDIPVTGGEILLVDRRAFDALNRSLAAAAGAEVLEGEFRTVQQGRKLLSRVMIEGEERTIESDYLVASDGVNSRVRRALGIEPAGYVFTVSSVMEGLDSDACEFWFSSEHAPRAYSWVFPKEHPGGGKVFSVGTGVMHGREGRQKFEKFLKRLKVDGQGDPAARGYKVPLWDEGLYSIGNILFAGDSATQVMPFTYEGIYYAMKSGAFAADAIIGDRPSLYRKLWRKRFLSRFRLMKTLERVFLQSDERAERLFDIFSRPEVQEASMRLWLRKDAGQGSLFSYIKIFRKFLH